MGYPLSYYESAVLAIEGASAMTTSTAPAVSNAAWMPTPHVSGRVADAVAEVIAWVASAPGNTDREGLFTTKLKVAHNTLMNAAVLEKFGPLMAVRLTFNTDLNPADNTYLPADPDDVRAIESYRRRRFAPSPSLDLDHYGWNYDNGRLYHTAVWAAVDYVPKTILTDSANVPERYANAIIARACSMLPVGCSPTRIDGANYFHGVWQAALQAIMSNMPAPRVEPYRGD
jgi:hypothetical protein